MNAIDILNKNNVPMNIMVDCSHGNSGKDYRKQKEVIEYLSDKLILKENNNQVIIGLMIESNINEGKQKLVFGEKQNLKYGVSITDSCISIDETAALLLDLYDIL